MLHARKAAVTGLTAQNKRIWTGAETNRFKITRLGKFRPQAFQCPAHILEIRSADEKTSAVRDKTIM
jgi:hypothetical protein